MANHRLYHRIGAQSCMSTVRRITGLSLKVAALGGLIFAGSLHSEPASAQTGGTITILDLDNGPITATEVGGPGNANTNLTANRDTPETINGSIQIDGLVTGGTGYAVLKEGFSTDISDLLTVTTRPNGNRGGGQPYYTATWTFLSDTDPDSIDLSTLGLPDNVVTAIRNAGLNETGRAQAMDGILIDSVSGESFSVPNLSIMVTSRLETPEPSSLAIFGIGAMVFSIGKLRHRSRRMQ